MPIVTQLDIIAEAQPVTLCPNYRMADWKKVRERLAAKLEMLQLSETIHTEAEFFSHLGRLTQAITDMVDTTIPKLKPALAQKHWWFRELADRCREVHRMAHRAYGRRMEPEDLAHHEYRTARKAYTVMIKNAKMAHWEDFLTTVDKRSVWTAHQYASGDATDGGSTQIPTLKTGTC